MGGGGLMTGLIGKMTGKSTCELVLKASYYNYFCNVETLQRLTTITVPKKCHILIILKLFSNTEYKIGKDNILSSQSDLTVRTGTFCESWI